MLPLLRELGLPATRFDHPRWLPLWSEQAPQALLEALGRPDRAVVVGHDVVAGALAGAGLAVRRVPVVPPLGQHQAAWLAGRPVPADSAPLIPVAPAPDTPQVLLFPGSGGLRKCWPADRFAALGRALEGRGRSVGVVLGPDELDRGPGPQAFDGLRLYRAPDLLETAALCAGAELVVGNDAGTTHLAAATGARTLALFGPTDPVRWRPLGPEVQVIRVAKLSELSVARVLAVS